MKNVVLILLALIIVSIIVLLALDKNDDNDNKDIIHNEREIGTWRYNGNIENGSLRLHNNVWGLTQEERREKSAKVYIYYKFDGSFGWEWNRTDPSPDSDIYTPPIYPEVTIGTIPYVISPYPTTDYLPIKLENISYMTTEVEYEYIKRPTGSYNMAYDMWFIDKNGTKNAEVMIWVQGNLNGILPEEYVSDGINEYGYYYKPPEKNRTWEYHAFILKNQYSMPLNYSINIKRLLDMLMTEGSLKNDWILPSMSLGNEVWKGSGKIEINKFNVMINGNNI